MYKNKLRLRVVDVLLDSRLTVGTVGSTAGERDYTIWECVSCTVVGIALVPIRNKKEDRKNRKEEGNGNVRFTSVLEAAHRARSFGSL